MRQALGKGLEALLPKSTERLSAAATNEPIKIPLDKIRPNHLQPRKHFDPEHLSELAASIKEHGLAQPILVSYDSAFKTYELIAGERRLRATELAGLKEIEVIVRNPESDKERLALALIENIQRKDLNPIEEALGYLRLMKEAQINQTELTRIIGKSKSALSNTLRLLELPENIQNAMQHAQITEGHGRALLMVKNPIEKQSLFNKILEQKLSVRDAEDMARAQKGEGDFDAEDASPLKKTKEKSADLKALETNLQQVLGTKVEIRTKKDPASGKITIHFYSLSDFDKIVKTIIK